jgi:hypothetical protein
VSAAVPVAAQTERTVEFVYFSFMVSSDGSSGGSSQWLQ